ncbi:NAD(P)-dependent oxidoreductase [Prochlorococcus sp. MIT 1011]|uniref:NAD(P)-dependent oxidoreductase n=1 Tax=Prochlorococcus sp. MIT 1011 TaxID=3082520 RepID=UPI0039B4E1B8
MSILVLTAKRVNPLLLEIIYEKFKYRRIKTETVFYEDGQDKIDTFLSRNKAVMCAPGRWIEKDIIKKNSHIKLYQLWSSGFDKFNSKACKDSNIKICTNFGNNAVSVSEHTLLLMLSLSKKLPEMNQRTVTGNWSGNCNGAEMHTLNSRSLFLIGLGNIGKKVAKLALAFGMQVFYFDIKRSIDYEKLGLNYVDINRGLALADYISLHLHDNESTKNIINENNCKFIKKGSFLINVSRASLISDKALSYLINNNLISGIGNDVFKNEPTDGTEQILKYKNSVFTPHIAGSTIEAISECIEFCCSNLDNAISDRKFEFIDL